MAQSPSPRLNRTPEKSRSGTNAARLKFCGTIKLIKQLTWKAGVIGKWNEKPNGVWQFRLRNGAVMSWSSTKGTIWFDGPLEAREDLYRCISIALHRWVYPVSTAWNSHINSQTAHRRRLVRRYRR